MNPSSPIAHPASDNLATMSPEAMRSMVHEMQARQSALDLQNEALRQTQADLADTQARYSDLYDQAPVGYVTLSGPGRILEANLTAATLLGVAREVLVTQPISRYIGQEYQESFQRHCQQLFETGSPQKCELRMVRNDGSLFWAHHAARVVRNAAGEEVCHVVLTDITSRKGIEQSLRNSEEKYRKLHESITDAFVIVDMDGRIIESNRAYQEMLGYTDEELCRLTYFEITPVEWHSFENQLVTGQILPLGCSELYQKEYRRKDGTLVPVEMRTFLIRDSEGNPSLMWAIVRDITKRTQEEQALQDWNQTLEQRVAERTFELQQSEARFLQLAAATFEGIAITEDGILIDGNLQLGVIHGCELAEMLGRPVADFIAPESQAWVARQIKDARETTYEFVGLRKDGSTFPGEIHARMSEWHGKITRVSAVRDLTAVKQTAARLRAKQTELEQAHRLALLSEVGAGIIHQIGQPLCAMGVNLAVTLARYQACESKTCGCWEILRDIEAGVGGMRDSITHLKTLAHPEQPVRDRLDFNEVLAGVLRLLRQEADSRQILVTVEMDPKLPPVQGDAVQLSQVILILARNAFDACANCPPERRTVAITTRSAEGGGVELSVRDAGTGITPEAMARMFTAFFTTKSAGLGIGLRLCQTIVKAHGGRIGGSNNPAGAGATFRVVLPSPPS